MPQRSDSDIPKYGSWHRPSSSGRTAHSRNTQRVPATDSREIQDRIRQLVRQNMLAAHSPTSWLKTMCGRVIAWLTSALLTFTVFIVITNLSSTQSIEVPRAATTYTVARNNVSPQQVVGALTINVHSSRISSFGANNTIFRVGDQVRFSFQLSQSGYVYLLNRDAVGEWRLLFPNNYQRSPWMMKGQHALPDDGYTFKAVLPRGPEYVYLITTAHPLLDRTWQRVLSQLASTSGSLDSVTRTLEAHLQNNPWDMKRQSVGII